MPNDVLAGTVGWWFLDDVMPHHEIAPDNYHISTEQQDDVLAHLSLFHICVRCIVEPNHDKNCEEEVSWHGFCQAWMFH